MELQPEPVEEKPEESRHAVAYRKEWATLTGKSESEIYVPEALR